MNPFPRARRYTTGLVLVAVAPLAMAFGDAWDFTPRVSLGQDYSDNIGLAPPGDEESEFITQVNTGFSLNRDGARASAQLGYNLQSLFYWQDSNDSALFHQFFGDGRVELIPGQLFVDSAASYSQRQLTRERAGADNLNLNNNRGDVLTFSFSPVYIQQFDDLATGQLSYSYNRVDVQDSEANNSQRHAVSLGISSGPQFTRFGWGLSVNYSQTDFDDNASSTQQNAEVLGRWAVTDRLNLFAVLGYEQDEFDQDNGRSDPNGLIWRLGSTYTPNDRTSMEAFFGERFFGTTYGATARHQLRNSQFTLDYTESVTSVNQFEIDQTIPRGVNATIEESLIVDGEPFLFDLETPALRSGSFVSKRLSAAYTGQRRKLGWGLRVFHEQRDYEVSNDSEEAQSFSGNLSWQWRPRTSLFANASVQESTFAGQDGEETLYSTRLGISRQLGNQVSASVQYSYRDLDSDRLGSDGYQENRVSATLVKTF
ncbi:MAG: TIGR03016 family PEP-CTERM system-associated outer membrane protein [Lamprobacter sp.]|uniref:TIGR03016 family PEP-CTERM system-associated outer membrane protein n=1 Tax=Lamprobacter sp. TaxID=3100796 RepID=UPI002B261669|nr:TIGR03016 family PEP-CTERM system-associated outer membrane protein [Lamprobacter sp.]MEA3641368.1 TIGR03016 family PEP-CTERM system-associated outer membrane protein [Lamprobacter sp.]